jgi:hypothetical protein
LIGGRHTLRPAVDAALSSLARRAMPSDAGG